jgi:hypothetical protein
MASTVFTDAVTPIVSSWLNDVNTAIYKANSSIAGSTARSALAKFADTFSVKDFGAVGDGVTNDLTAFQAAYTAAISAGAEIVIPAGTYALGSTWTLTNPTRIRPLGPVTLKFTGTGQGLVIDGSGIGGCYGMIVGGEMPLRVFGNASITDLVFTKQVHHSSINVICKNGTTGLRTNFCIANVYRVECSVNSPGMTNTPTNGIFIDSTSTNQTTTCVFHGCVIEGMTGDGVVIAGGSMNTFIGGTIEGNTGHGLKITSATSNCFLNNFIGVDFEANTAGDVEESNASQTTYDGCDSTSSMTFDASSTNATVMNCRVNSIVNNGTLLRLYNVLYGISAGSITGSGGPIVKREVYNSSGNTPDIDQSLLTQIATVSCTTGTATSAVTLPATGTRNYVVSAFLPGAASASNYNAIAFIAQNVNTSVILSQTNGTLLTITLVSGVIKVTQSSGTTQSVQVICNPL